MKIVKQLVADVWKRYNANMSAGRMRQRPGRSEYLIELVKLGIVPDTTEAKREFYLSNTTPLHKAIIREERKQRKAI